MTMATVKTDTRTLKRPALYTDYYELTMAQGYYLSGRAGEKASFDYFFRDLPYEGGRKPTWPGLQGSSGEEER